MGTVEALCFVCFLVSCCLQCKCTRDTLLQRTHSDVLHRDSTTSSPGATMVALQIGVLWTILATGMTATRWHTAHGLSFGANSKGGMHAAMVGQPFGPSGNVATCKPKDLFPQLHEWWLGVGTRDWNPTGHTAGPRGWSADGSGRSPLRAPWHQRVFAVSTIMRVAFGHWIYFN